MYLTGSSTPADKTEVHHSGAGRIAPLNMRPMTLWESKESKGTVSLNDLFEDSENERFRNKKPEVLRMILRSYARNISSEAAVSTIISDIRQSNERTMDTKTYDYYMEALKDLYIIEDMEAWVVW